MTPDPAASLRRSCYLLLGAAAVAVAAARVAGSENLFEPSRYTPPTPDAYSAYPPDPPRKWPAARPDPTPMFSSNDRSRWATVRALVEDGTYVIGRRGNFDDKAGPWDDRGVIFEDAYKSLDKVMDPATGKFYSSKPPLFPTLVAGQYLLLNRALGWDLDRHRWHVAIAVLLTVNVLPFAVYLLLLARLIEDHGTTDFGRLLAFAAGCFGTFLTTFAGTLTNHNPGTYCVLFAIYPLLRKVELTTPRVAASGFFAGAAATFEFPAAALLAGLFGLSLVSRPRAALLAFLPAAAVPLAALFATNYLATGRLEPVYSEFGGPWYNYPGSHWAKVGTAAAKGIDFADVPKLVYAFHLLFGHHGWFSLTPVWLLAAGGLAAVGWRGGPEVKAVLAAPGRGKGTLSLPLFAALTVAVSAAVFAFYVAKTNNYGGFTSGPRWLFWLTPLWLVGLLPAGDRVGRSAAGRLLAAGLLGLSAFSAFYPLVNPWRPPWVLQLLETEGWLRY